MVVCRPCRWSVCSSAAEAPSWAGSWCVLVARETGSKGSEGHGSWGRPANHLHSRWSLRRQAITQCHHCQALLATRTLRGRFCGRTSMITQCTFIFFTLEAIRYALWAHNCSHTAAPQQAFNLGICTAERCQRSPNFRASLWTLHRENLLSVWLRGRRRNSPVLPRKSHRCLGRSREGPAFAWVRLSSHGRTWNPEHLEMKPRILSVLNQNAQIAAARMKTMLNLLFHTQVCSIRTRTCRVGSRHETQLFEPWLVWLLMERGPIQGPERMTTKGHNAEHIRLQNLRLSGKLILLETLLYFAESLLWRLLPCSHATSPLVRLATLPS